MNSMFKNRNTSMRPVDLIVRLKKSMMIQIEFFLL